MGIVKVKNKKENGIERDAEGSEFTMKERKNSMQDKRSTKMKEIMFKRIKAIHVEEI